MDANDNIINNNDNDGKWENNENENEEKKTTRNYLRTTRIERFWHGYYT